jgi:hypothetical protein
MKSHRPLLPLLLCAATALPLGAARTAPGSTQQQSQATQQQNLSGQNAAPQQNSGAQNPGGQPNIEPTLQQAQENASKEIVPLREEPHHQLVMQNDFARIYTVGVPPNDATANHRHDLPYLAINFGAADVENDVQGKPPAHLQLADGQLVYSPGGFAHVAKTSGAPFRNVTIELLKPQQNARNLCKQIIEGPLSCAQEEASKNSSTQIADSRSRLPASAPRKKNSQQAADAPKKPSSESGDDSVPYFETDEVRAGVVTVSSGRDYVDESPKSAALLVAMTNSNVDVNLGGQHVSFLHSGDILWMPAGTDRRVTDFLGTRSNFLLVTFKDSATSTRP